MDNQSNGCSKWIQTIEKDIELLEPDVAIGVSAKNEIEGKDDVIEWMSGTNDKNGKVYR